VEVIEALEDLAFGHGGAFQGAGQSQLFRSPSFSIAQVDTAPIILR
jgi:hypothetical protein